MSLSDFSPIAAAALTAHVLGREPTGAEIERLLEVAGEVLTPKDVEKVIESGQEVAETREDPDRVGEYKKGTAGQSGGGGRRVGGTRAPGETMAGVGAERAPHAQR